MGLFSFIKNAIQEGIDEAKEELKQEAEEYQKYKNEPVTLEKKAIALACPFREILISSSLAGFAPHLYKLGVLTDKEKDEAKKLLSRDFNISNDENFKKYKDEFINSLNVLISVNKENKDIYSSLVVASASIELYILTAGIDVGYVAWEDVQPAIIKLVETITKQSGTHSWEQFAKRFLEGEKEAGINNVLGRKVMQSRVKWLLSDEESPWINLKWEEL